MSLMEQLNQEHHFIRDFVSKVHVAAELYGWGERPPETFFELAMDFSDTFIEKYHHIKEEAVLFKLLANKLAGDLDQQVKTLENQHKKVEGFIKEIKRCLPGYLSGDKNQNTIFWRSLGGYVSFLRAHLNREEHMFFPLIERVLTKSEQKEMERIFENEEMKLGKDYLKNCKRVLAELTNVLEEACGDRYKYLMDSVASKRGDFKAA